MSGPVLVPPPQPPPAHSWRAKLTSLLFAVFCFELGAFLLIFPWTDVWEHNYFAWIRPDTPERLQLAQWWRGVWLSPAFRGAVSGLGLLNLWVALSSVFRLRRYAPAPEPALEEPTLPLE